MPTGTVSIPATALGARLRDLRQAHEWTQWQLATMLETRANRISDWETGRYEPGLPVLKKFADVFELTVAELLDGIM
jgi:transcriptional regulator with XRE-family HTH domain